ncbi:MAG: putative metal-binding motif-containing protein [Nitrospira sp.]|nr:putative metal-binding motif-containing protein [Nitrospira sp.]
MGTTIKNNGSSELSIGKIEGPPLPFSIVLDSCSDQVLGPSATCSIKFSYSSLEGTSRISSVNIPSNDPEKKLVTLTLGVYPDNDGDGYTLDVDCNDNDAAVHLGAVEVQGNNKDDDCNPATMDHTENND